MRLGIVSTVRSPGPMLDSFIRYHRAIGFERFLLFFDDPDDADLARARQYPEVTAIPCDAAHARAQAELPAFAVFGPQRATYTAARQILNAEMGMRLAADLGLDWLLHLDDDELFHSPLVEPAAHFAALDAAGVQQGSYLNLEAVPETLEVGDPFREVTLFKRNPWTVRSLLVGANLDFWQARGHYFVGYAEGKSAARVDRRLTATTPHWFQAGEAELVTREMASPAILHFPSCGLQRHVRKFQRLGAAPDEAWRGMPISIAFFKEARDLAVAGDHDGFRRLYEQAVVLQDETAIEQQIRTGILKRLRRPSQVLATLSPAPTPASP